MLEVREISRAFGRLKAVEGVTLSVMKNQIRGLIGPNGSGKSTTMNLISGSLKPSAGKIELEGQRIEGKEPHRIARLGLIRTFQLTRVFTSGTLLDAVALGVRAASGSPWSPARWIPAGDQAEVNHAALVALERMGLAHRANELAGSLPGGLRRILTIATALAAKPKIMLLDEPLAGLNATEKAEVANRIEKLRTDDVSILLVEHDMRSVMRLCDRITVLNFGQVIAEGTPAEIGRHPDVIKAYLGQKRVRDA
ncbi:ABC transporter ATP-binding protein [Mesorhizobium ciceri]|uniref:ABC transporter ATP-binding protein n=2 Tax=Mesorhizobium TaxID=68287 RepID=UPI000478EED7|nr:ABC transporter ATP-binding protein [Mesorhizobium ciceri]